MPGEPADTDSYNLFSRKDGTKNEGKCFYPIGAQGRQDVIFSKSIHQMIFCPNIKCGKIKVHTKKCLYTFYG